MNPLDALSSLTQAQLPASNIGFQPTAAVPSNLTKPVSESFENMLQPGQIVDPTVPSVSVSSAGSPNTWGHMVQQMVMDVNAKQVSAGQKVSDVLQGGPTPVHEAMVATEEASLSFAFLAEMRNKVVESYQTVMQMQV
jgi:flagellar hook-basal body complex protein FliE